MVFCVNVCELQRQKRWNEELDDCSARLATAEAIKSRWGSIAAAADKSTILDQLKVNLNYPIV